MVRGRYFKDGYEVLGLSAVGYVKNPHKSIYAGEKPTPMLVHVFDYGYGQTGSVSIARYEEGFTAYVRPVSRPYGEVYTSDIQWPTYYQAIREGMRQKLKWDRLAYDVMGGEGGPL